MKVSQLKIVMIFISLSIIASCSIMKFSEETPKEPIPFKILEGVESYSDKSEGATTNNKDDAIEVYITKKFSTSGNSIEVEKVVENSNGNYEIHLSITPPCSDSILLQVITYKTIGIEVDKKDLQGEPPYVFEVWEDFSRLNKKREIEDY